MSAVLDRIAEDPRVASVSDESDGRGGGDGYWVYLKLGWCSEPALHAVHEWSIKDLRRAFRNITQCDCTDCEKAAKP